MPKRTWLALLLCSALAARAELVLESSVHEFVPGAGAAAGPVAHAVAPGTELRYVVTLRNRGAEAVEAARIETPMPPGVEYVPGSAHIEPGRARLSVDGGRHFVAPQALTPDQQRGVDVILWERDGPLGAGAAQQVSFRGRLRPPREFTPGRGPVGSPMRAPAAGPAR